MMCADGLLVECYRCQGTGRSVVLGESCADCQGQGKIISKNGHAVLDLIRMALETGALTLPEPCNADAPIPYQVNDHA